MNSLRRIVTIAGMGLLLMLSAQGQQSKKTGILEGSDLKQVAPTTYFFDGQVAPVQLRNCAAVRSQDGKVIEAGLVDSSGYSSGIAAKYQGFLITEQKITIEGSSLPVGQYGFGFAEGKFRVMDVGGNDVFLVGDHQDENLKRPVPLKITEENGGYRLYAGKKYVTIKLK
jgi:hypothetical protein